MAVTVSLHEVVEEIGPLMDGFTAYLNRRTGELFTIGDEDEALLDDDADPDDLPEWQREGLPKIREVLTSEDWLPLPTKFDIHEWEIMDQFARAVEDPVFRNDLMNAIRGAGAFRYFKDTVFRYGARDVWYEFRTAALERIAIDWLEEREIAYRRGKGDPSGR